MLAYIIFIVLTLVFSITFDGYENNRSKNIEYGIVCLYTILLIGLRNGVGGDTQAYMEFFEEVPTNPVEYSNYIKDMMILNGFMPGWSMLTIICKVLFDSFYAVQIIQTVIVNLCVFYIFKKYTKHIFLCVLIYGISGQLFNFNTEIMREGIAIAIGSIGMYQYLRGNKLSFYLLIGVSLLFHISAVILLIFPFIRIKEITFKTLLTAFGISFFLWFASDFVVGKMVEFIASESSIANKVISYSDQQSNIFGFLMNAIILFVTQIGIMFFAKETVCNNEILEKDYAHYMGFALLIAVLICGIPGFRRFANYTIIFYLIMITEFVFNLKKQLVAYPVAKLIVLGSFIYFTTAFYIQYWPQNERYHYEFFVPYTSAFDEYVDNSYRISMHLEAVTPKEIDSKNSRSF